MIDIPILLTALAGAIWGWHGLGAGVALRSMWRELQERPSFERRRR